MAENFSNDFQTTLSAAIANASDTAISVVSGAGAPAANFRIRVGNEYMLVTSIGAGTNWTVTRGIEGSTAAAHVNGTVVAHVVTTGGFQQYVTNQLTGGTVAANFLSVCVGGAVDNGLDPLQVSAANSTGVKLVYPNSLGAAGATYYMGQDGNGGNAWHASNTRPGSAIGDQDKPAWVLTYGYADDSFRIFRAPANGVGGALAFTQLFKVNASGRVLIGTNTDDGANRLQVVGGISGSTLSAVTSITTPTLRVPLGGGQYFTMTTGLVGSQTSIDLFTPDHPLRFGAGIGAGPVANGALFQGFPNTNGAFPGDMYFDAGGNAASAIYFRTGWNAGAGVVSRWKIPHTGGHLLAATDNAVDIGASGANRPRNVFVAGNITVGDATALIKSSVAMNSGAGVGAGTITNAPAAGDPTKWIPINDNGTTRYVPAW
jgi:hypothetical protein